MFIIEGLENKKNIYKKETKTYPLFAVYFLIILYWMYNMV